MENCKNAQRQCEEYRDKFVEYEQQLTDYEGLMIQFNELQHECNVYQTQNDELQSLLRFWQLTYRSSLDAISQKENI